jgi:MFS-type transporter involved in bile tolerance (Atg22 family)
MVAILTQSSRAGIASVALFFVAGAALLMFIDEKKIATQVKEAMDKGHL